MSRYVTEGKLCKEEKLIFIETGQNVDGYAVGTWLHELIDNIPEGANVRITIDFEK